MSHVTHMKYELQGAFWHGNTLCFVHGTGDHDPHVAGGVVRAVFT